MFISKDKTIIDINYKPDRVDGWLVDNDLASKIKSHYPWFDFVFKDEDIVDIVATKPQIIPNIPTAEERIGQLETDKLAMQEVLDGLLLAQLEGGM